MAPLLSAHSPTACGGKVVAPATKGDCISSPAGRLYGFPRAKPGCPVFAAKGGIKNGARRRRTSPAQRYYITPEGGSPQPACKAKPITGRTLAAQGQRPGGAINPRPRKRASIFGNTGKHRPGPGPDPDRAERRLNPYAPKGVSHFPLSSFLCYNIGKFEPQSFLQGGLTYGKDSCCIRSSAAGSVAG